MSTPLTIPQLDQAVAAWIEQRAKLTGIPVELVARDLIYRGVEAEQRNAMSGPHHELDALAGTWTDEEAEEFNRAVGSHRDIDPSIW